MKLRLDIIFFLCKQMELWCNMMYCVQWTSPVHWPCYVVWCCNAFFPPVCLALDCVSAERKCPTCGHEAGTAERKTKSHFRGQFSSCFIFTYTYAYAYAYTCTCTSRCRCICICIAYTRKNATDLLQSVAPSGLIQVWYHSCVRLLSPTDCSELTVSDWNSLLGCQGCISLM